jgi:hypothetical protein
LVAKATGLAFTTICAGIRECKELNSIPTTPDSLQEPISARSRTQGRSRVRLPGGGRKLIEVKDPAIVPTLQRLLANEVGGDPMSERRWVRSSLNQALQMAERGWPSGEFACGEEAAQADGLLTQGKRKEAGPEQAQLPGAG